jgi:Raf kinase inhibitor-like YbhB/YbcL family protein
MQTLDRLFRTILTVTLFVAAPSCSPGGQSPANKGNSMSFTIQSGAFANGGTIPRRYTCDGENLSPALEWTGESAGTRSFALIVDDPDAPVGTWNHWLLWNIPADVHALKEGFRPGELATSGVNDFGRPGYGGPCPPKGHGPHRYFFRLFALDTPNLEVSGQARRVELDRALANHVLARTEYMGRYERK